MPAGAEVVVVGGGIIGLSVTYYLAKQGVDVAVVEKGDFASGTSSHCMAGLQLCTKIIGPKLDLAVEGIKMHHSLENELGEDLEFTEQGGMIVAQNEREAQFLAERVAGYKRAGINMEFLNAEDSRRRQPVLAKDVVGSLYSPRDCQLNPLGLAMAFVRRSQALGAKTYPFHTVTGIEVKNGRITSVVTSGGEIPTRTVVNAAGPWAPNLARFVGLDLPIVPRQGQILVTEPSPPLYHGLILSADYLLSKDVHSANGAAGRLLSGVVTNQTQRGNCLIGSTRAFVGYDIRTSHEGIRALVRNVVRLIPPIGGLHVIRSYAGLRPATPDGIPIMERAPQLPDFITAAGHEGDAIALGPVSGKLIAQLITGKLEAGRLAPFASSRFDRSQGDEAHDH